MDVRITKHAAERWAERVRVGLDAERAAADLEAVRAVGEVRLLERSEVRGPQPHLVLGDVALPLVRSGDAYVATTCLALDGDAPPRGRRFTRSRDGRRRREPYRRPRHVDWLALEA